MAYSESEFNEAVEKLNRVNAKDLLSNLDSKEESLVFVGRPTCPYCRKFLPKLIEIIESDDLEFAYLDSTATAESVAIQEFREQAQVATVPALVRIGGEKRLENLGIDSSDSVESIREKIAQ
ncbi:MULTISPECIES: thioredoxin domain-containing protein [Aerococcus]|uniref:bacterocin transport accessory protein n=1 Tax=Aerococcus TaxID=1375 RepID=UPI000DCEBD60|nr:MULTISPECIES: bacterocin transport accessory protein [Aerococcus]KAA9232609.1 bacterocin transport accessory protein [Aerococcus mictus]MBU5610458.1 bacterocin transport accessory protein [Aerococcus urinae]MDK6292573.1 bacterocin transport accessory protein [Aerococcus urinae]MDK6375952.1 bacterocin transport accessory protein [Aerococcus urinae]MDK6420692.1 bacterocin transport accessory protein [Aerococcus urinae]